MVALQNRHNKGVACKIVQDKELCALLDSASSFWLEGGTKRTRPDDDWKKDLLNHCATKEKNILQAPAKECSFPVPIIVTWSARPLIAIKLR
jgi:hypothetical protein